MTWINESGPSPALGNESAQVPALNPITSFVTLLFILAGLAVGSWVSEWPALAFFAAAGVVLMSLKMANVWQKFVILRKGKLQSVQGAGMFAIIPTFDSIAAVTDERIQTTAFNAEQALAPAGHSPITAESAVRRELPFRRASGSVPIPATAETA